jgi:hypothetical protein
MGMNLNLSLLEVFQLFRERRREEQKGTKEPFKQKIATRMMRINHKLQL